MIPHFYISVGLLFDNTVTNGVPAGHLYADGVDADDEAEGQGDPGRLEEGKQDG